MHILGRTNVHGLTLPEVWLDHSS